MKGAKAIVGVAWAVAVWTPGIGAQQSYPTPHATDDAGFHRIFDGRTLDGWEGDPKYWRVENGALVGEVTPDTLLQRNSFIIWRGGTTKDFELKVEYRVSAQGNSGINYRSIEVPGVPWALQGYQADLDGALRYSGNNYEERGRTFMAQRGEITLAGPRRIRQVIATFATSADLQAHVRKDDWNEYHLIVRSNVLLHFLNGHLMSEVIDEDPRAPARGFARRAGTRRAADEG